MTTTAERQCRDARCENGWLIHHKPYPGDGNEIVEHVRLKFGESVPEHLKELDSTICWEHEDCLVYYEGVVYVDATPCKSCKPQYVHPKDRVEERPREERVAEHAAQEQAGWFDDE